MAYVGIDDLPEAGLARVDAPLGLEFSCEAAPVGAERVAVRIVRPRRVGLRPDLLDRVLDPIDIQVETHVEEVLVDHRVQSGRHQRAVLRTCSRRHAPGGEDAGQLDLEGDRSVLVQVPEEPVVVVADRRERGDDQAS